MKLLTKIILSTLGLLLAFTVIEIAKSPSINQPAIYFFDVGQGDAILIQKGDCQILLDGGPDDKVLNELGKVMPLYDHKIETVILTHPHADHLVGLNAVLDRYEVGQVFGSGVVYTSNSYLEFLQKIKDKKINLSIPKIGEKLTAFENGELIFLWPGEKNKEKTAENLNDSSIVARFCYWQECMILTGDIESDEQAAMLQYYQNNLERVQAKIIKMPHHGSENGLNDLLIQAIKPKIAMISVGKDNQYGHPSKIVLDYLEKQGISILRTDYEGTIRVPLIEKKNEKS